METTTSQLKLNAKFILVLLVSIHLIGAIQSDIAEKIDPFLKRGETTWLKLVDKRELNQKPLSQT